MRLKILVILLLNSLLVAAQEEGPAPVKNSRRLVTAEVSLVRTEIGVEQVLTDHFYLKVSGGIGLNYLATNDRLYPRYQEYLNGPQPAYETHGPLSFGDTWWALGVSSELRYYLRLSSQEPNPGVFQGLYVGVLYRFAGRELGTREASESHGGFSTPVYTTTRISQYRPAHKTGLVFGFQSFTGKRKRGLFDLRTGIGPLWNSDFSQAALLPYANLSFSVVLHHS